MEEALEVCSDDVDELPAGTEATDELLFPGTEVADELLPGCAGVEDVVPPGAELKEAPVELEAGGVTTTGTDVLELTELFSDVVEESESELLELIAELSDALVSLDRELLVISEALELDTLDELFSSSVPEKPELPPPQATNKPDTKSKALGFSPLNKALEELCALILFYLFTSILHLFDPMISAR